MWRSRTLLLPIKTAEVHRQKNLCVKHDLADLAHYWGPFSFAFFPPLTSELNKKT